MLVRTQILIFGLLGNVIIAGILLYMNVQNQSIQEKSASSQYSSIVESAWVQSVDDSFANLSEWGIEGSKGSVFWNPNNEIPVFIDEGVEGFDYPNILVESLVNENEGDLELLIEIMFEQDIDLANVSFVKLYDSDNEVSEIFVKEESGATAGDSKNMECTAYKNRAANAAGRET